MKLENLDAFRKQIGAGGGVVRFLINPTDFEKLKKEKYKPKAFDHDPNLTFEQMADKEGVIFQPEEAITKGHMLAVVPGGIVLRYKA
jgi:hypothetical protein